MDTLRPNRDFFKREISPEELEQQPAFEIETFDVLRDAVPRQRKDENHLSDEEKEAVRKAFSALLRSGQYNDLVNIHGNMAHDMHGRHPGGHASPTGVQRFLPWHRRYLWEMENALRAVNPTVTIPYWRWSHPDTARFPPWLEDFLPRGLVNLEGRGYDVFRELNDSDPLPDRTDIQNRLTDNHSYTPLTLALEGWRPYGAHNQVHVYIGGTMSTQYSPADPIFWLHHAECDRLWHIWQGQNPGEVPSLSGTKARLDPWAERFDEVLDITSPHFAYQYEELDV